MLKYGKCSQQSNHKNSNFHVPGLNIKKIGNQESQFKVRQTHANFVRLNHRKRLDLNISCKNKLNTQNQFSQQCLPSKTFKIRSFTRKHKHRENIKLQELTQIFEKLQNLRNFKSVSNRLQLLSYSQQQKRNDEKDSNNAIQTKIKQILRRQADIKCKVSPQVFVSKASNRRESIKKTDQILSKCNFQQFQTQSFRQISHQIQVYFNPQRQNCSLKNLLIVSLQSLQVKKYAKVFEETKESQKNQSFNFQLFQILKMLSYKFTDFDISLKDTSVCYKVKDMTQLQELKHFLHKNKIKDYNSIFYPIKKYAQEWNLFLIDQVIQNAERIVFVQPKYRFKQQFPILSKNIPILFIPTSVQTQVSISKIIGAIKSIFTEITQSNNKNISQQDKTLQFFNNDQNQQKESDNIFSNIKTQILPGSNLIKFQKSYADINYSIKCQNIIINTEELIHKIKFTKENKQLKQLQNYKKNAFMFKRGLKNRKVLGDRNTNIDQKQVKQQKTLKDISETSNKILSLQEMKQSLLQHIQGIENNCNYVQLSQKKNDTNDKGDVDNLTNQLSGMHAYAKRPQNIVQQLVRYNAQNFKEINSFYANTTKLRNHPLFNPETKNHENQVQVNQIIPKLLTICLHKIF